MSDSTITAACYRGDKTFTVEKTNSKALTSSSSVRERSPAWTP